MRPLRMDSAPREGPTTCSWELTGLEDVGKVGSLLHGEVSSDGRASSGDLGLDGRIRIYGTVEHDGDLLADVLLGDAGPGVGTFGVHGHGD